MDKHPGFSKTPNGKVSNDIDGNPSDDPITQSLIRRRKSMAAKRGVEEQELDSLGNPVEKEESSS